MKIDEIVYDVFEILNQLEDDRDIDELWLFSKINAYRAQVIQDEYKTTREINPIWLQRIRKFAFKKVTADDDPYVFYSSISVGKYRLPSVISLPDDLGMNRIAGSSAIRSLDPTDFNTLLLKAQADDVEPGYGYYAKLANDIYCWPFILEGSAIIIAENPFEVPDIDMDTNLMKIPSISDSYPLDIANTQKVILLILTKEMQINAQSISDITNDSQSQLKILNSNAASKG
jgi:hypothetical protein